jgi:hypothetical protein
MLPKENNSKPFTTNNFKFYRNKFIIIFFVPRRKNSIIVTQLEKRGKMFPLFEFGHFFCPFLKREKNFRNKISLIFNSLS